MRRKAKTNAVSTRNRIVMWVIVALAAGLIAYGAWLGQNISIG